MSGGRIRGGCVWGQNKGRLCLGAEEMEVVSGDRRKGGCVWRQNKGKLCLEAE